MSLPDCLKIGLSLLKLFTLISQLPKTILYIQFNMGYEWDDNKRIIIIRKHGVDFEQVYRFQ